MRRGLAIVAIAVMSLGMGGVALAEEFEPEGGSGSTFDGSQVTCGEGNTFIPDDPIVVYNDGRGVEVCSDSAPVQGRVIAYHSSGLLTIDFIHVDGDADNPAPLPQGHVIHIPVGLP
jgi:hypothetical protein